MGDLYEEHYKKLIQNEKTAEEIRKEKKFQAKFGRELWPPLSYTDWDKTVAAGQDPILKTKKYW